MRDKWIEPNIIIGNAATGNLYYRRTKIEDIIIKELEKGNHILFSAPRRVGKTSVVKYLAENFPGGANCIFKNIQDNKSATDFLKSFYHLILSSLKKNQKVWNQFLVFAKTRGIKKISLEGGIEFIDPKEIDYANEIEILLTELKKNQTKVILFIDELPDVLHHLFENDRADEAHLILKKIRSWRQNFQKGILTIVWIGSIGLYHIVERIGGRTSDLNDLFEIQFDPFSQAEAANYIQEVTQCASVKYTKKLTQYIIQKVGYCIPYNINLLLLELHKIAVAIDATELDIDHIEKAFNTIVKENKNFDDYRKRLFDYFPKNDALFMNEVLTYIAHFDNINLRQLYDISKKYNQENNYIDFMDILERDGYVVENDGSYLFISPFLKAFWKRKHPIYEK